MHLRYLQNITIPAAFVTKSVGDSLKTLIKPQKDLPHPKVLVSLDWTDLLPRNEVVGRLVMLCTAARLQSAPPSWRVQPRACRALWRSAAACPGRC